MRRIALALFVLGLLMQHPLAQSHSDYDTDDSVALSLSGIGKETGGITSFFWKGYIRGLSEALVGDNLICIPDGTTNFELQQVVMKYIADNPTTMHKSAFHTVLSAMHKAYPCQN